MINYLELNSREKYIVDNADYFTLWSKRSKKEFDTLDQLQDHVNNTELDNLKYLVYAVLDFGDACIGTIN